MKLFAWNDFWSRASFPNPASSFDSEYQQYSTSISIKFDPETRPENTEDKLYWSKIPLDISNYNIVGNNFINVTSSTIQILSINNLPNDKDIHLFGIRYSTTTSEPISPQEICWEFARTTRKVSITPANYTITFSESNDEWADWFEPIPAFSMVKHVPTPRIGGGITINYREGGQSGIHDGVGYHGKKILSPDYDWEIEFIYDIEIDTATIVSNAYPRYVTFAAVAGQQHIVGLQTKHGHGAWAEFYPSTLTPVGYSTSDAGATRLVPFATHKNQVQPLFDAHSLFMPWRTDRERPFGNNVQSKCKIKYTSSIKSVDIFHTDSVLGDNAHVLTLDSDSTNLSDVKRSPDLYHYPFGISPAISLAAFISSSTPINIRDIIIKSSCPLDYAEWCPGWGQAWTGRYIVPNKYDGNLGINIEDPNHTLNNFGFYVPWHTQGDLSLGFIGPANRFTTKLFSGYTAPINSVAQTTSHPETDVYPFRNLAFPYWTSRTGYQSGTFSGKTPFIDVPNEKYAKYVIFKGIQRAGTLKARLLDENDSPLTSWNTVSMIEGVSHITISQNIANKVRAEIEIYYDGSDVTTYFFNDLDEEQEVTYPYSPQNAPNYYKLDDTIPDTPSLFVGYAVYFDNISSSVISGSGIELNFKGLNGVIFPFNIKTQ